MFQRETKKKNQVFQLNFSIAKNFQLYRNFIFFFFLVNLLSNNKKKSRYSYVKYTSVDKQKNKETK